MPFSTVPLPAPLGAIDFSAPAMVAWLKAIKAQGEAVDLASVPLILLGAGSVIAQGFVERLIARGHVIALVDNAKAGATVKGVPVIGDGDLDALTGKVSDAVGIVCCSSGAAVDHFVKLWNDRGPLVSWFEVISRSAPGDDIGGSFAFLRDFGDEKQILALHAATRDVFDDVLSRQTFDALMLYRLTWDARVLAQVNRPEKAIYFEADVMPLGDHEVMVDGGAFDGDTVRDFAAKCAGRFAHVHSFEIDPRNAEAFLAGTADIPHVSLHRIGLWNAPGEMGFEARTDNCSRLSDTASVKVPLDALDNLGLGRVSLFKLDIEGAEFEALQGARRTIETYKPKLALSIYHKAGDFASLLPLVRDMRPDYRFRLRHYSSLIFDTVLYAT